MTAIYEADELGFQYPENWKLEEDPPSGLPRAISVMSSTGAFWCATVYDAQVPLEELRRQYLATLEQEYNELDQEATYVDLPPERQPAIDLQFFCLDFLVRSRLIPLRVGRHHVLLTWQAEDREFARVEPVFRAISHSMLQPRVT